MSVASPREIYVNLPVSDLAKSVDFFTRLGFEFDQRFTDENATCMILSDTAFVMLLTEEFFKRFTKKQISDSASHTEAILAISARSRAEVDELVNKALVAGGQPSNDPMDEGFMYAWSFQDLDGHLWEVMYMDESALEK